MSCAEFESPHTNERIAEHLQLIHSQYGLISSKIIATISDNAFNFVKALREFGDEIDEFYDDISDDLSDDENENDSIKFPEINGFTLA